MKKQFILLCVAALLAGCDTTPKNAGPTIFQGRFIGYGSEYVEFFLPTETGEYKEIHLNVQPDGSFRDTIQFDKNYYDAPLFADKFMFRICVEQGKTYDTEFDITEDGVETNFRFIGEGEAENRFLSHYWGLDVFGAIAGKASYKEQTDVVKDIYAPLLEELKGIDNKPFVKYYKDQIASMERAYAYYYPFFAADLTGTCPDDADFNSMVARNKKLSDEEFRAMIEPVCTNAAYFCKNTDLTQALKAAESCSVVPSQKETAMMLMLSSMVGAGNAEGLQEGYDYFSDTVKNGEYLDRADELCIGALQLAPGSDAPEIEFEDIQGKIYHLSDFAGKPLYIDLWASWCGPCCEEIPHLAKFVESLGKDPEIQCISISIDDERSDWTAKLAEVGSAWPQFLATQAGQESISGKYFVTGIPRFLLIDKDGKLASVNAPRPSDKDLLETLKSML